MKFDVSFRIIPSRQTSALLLLALFSGSLFCGPACAQTGSNLRPPSVPLVACDPYFSIWSPADKLTDANTVHWTGKPQRLTSLVRIDGKVFRLMGKEPEDVPAIKQTACYVTPTSTRYLFESEGVELGIQFLTPSLPESLDLLSSPITYVVFGMKGHDGQQHQVSVYFDAAAEIAVNQPAQEVVWSQESIKDVQNPQKGRFKLSSTRKVNGKAQLEGKIEPEQEEW